MLVLEWKDIESLRRFGNILGSLSDGEVRKIANRAINRAGDKSKTQVIRALTRQTGLKRPVIVKAVRVSRSSWATLTYTMTATGGDIALKHFGARETRKGVSAAPFGKRRVFAHTFIKGGRFPGRKDIGRGGHVFMPDLGVSAWGRGSQKQKSGVIIPVEMVQGQTAEAFERTAGPTLEQRMAHELARLMG